MRRHGIVWVGTWLICALYANLGQAQFGGTQNHGGMGFSFGTGQGGRTGGGFNFNQGGGFNNNPNLGRAFAPNHQGHNQRMPQRSRDFIPPSRNDGDHPQTDWNKALKPLVDLSNALNNNPNLNRPPRPPLVRPVPVQPVIPQPVRPVPVVPVAPPTATVKPNGPLPEKIVAVRRNVKFTLGELMPQPCYGLLAELARVRAQQIVIEIEPTIVVLANPVVLNVWTIIKGRVEQGQAVSADDLQRLQAAIEAIADLPAGVNRDELRLRIGRLMAFNKIIVVLSTPWPPGGWTPGIPSGVVHVIYCPCLPKDKHYWLPSGDLACGTGGTGQLSLASGEADKLLDIPVGVGEPLSPSDADVAKRITSGVLLMNPSENGATIQYVLGSKNYSLQPSFKQALPEGQQWVVNFDRGARNGRARYTLSKGSYVFGGSKRGWDLYNQRFEVIIDNSANTDPFYYAIDNTQAEVPPGGQAKHDSAYPLLLRFDRGDGMQEAQKQVDKKSLSLVVALNRADGLWDLFPSSNFPGQKLARKSEQSDRPLVLTGVAAPQQVLSTAPQTCE